MLMSIRYGLSYLDDVERGLHVAAVTSCGDDCRKLYGTNLSVLHYGCQLFVNLHRSTYWRLLNETAIDKMPNLL